MKAESEAYEGKWDFDGSCAPRGDGTPFYNGQQTFSLGCFQWVKRKGSGLKKGKVVYRVKGVASAPTKAYEAARAFCAKKNNNSRRDA